MRLPFVRWAPGAWKTGVERPDIKIFDAIATVEVVKGSPLREYHGDSAGAVFRAAVLPRERVVVTIGQGRKAVQMLISKLCP